jgi:hypothetical protein
MKAARRAAVVSVPVTRKPNVRAAVEEAARALIAQAERLEHRAKTIRNAVAAMDGGLAMLESP